MPCTQSAEEINKNIIINTVPRTTNNDSGICNYGSELHFLTNTTTKESGSLLTKMTHPATGSDLYSSCNGKFHSRKTTRHQNSARISS